MLKVVYTADTLLEAQLVRGLLEQNKIEATIQGEALWAARGVLPFTLETAPTVWVRKEDYEEARSVIKTDFAVARHRNQCLKCGYDLRGSPGPLCPECGRSFSRPQGWVCPDCGENLEGQFTDCWNCATGEKDDG